MNCDKGNLRESYGGYLPLEINPSKTGERKFRNGLNVLRLNTVVAGIPIVKENIKKNIIYCPYYLCPNVISQLKKYFENVVFYNITKDLLPSANIFDNPNAAVYLVNYFGVIGKKIASIIKRHVDTTFLVDNAHAFFEKPIMRDNIYTFYSCRKFFGVPDGAYLVSKERLDCNYSTFQSWQHSEYLLKSFECGTNSAYNSKKGADEYLLSHPGKMSFLTRSFLNNIDYRFIRKKRKQNFKTYEQEFGDINQITCEPHSIPYIYPFNVGKNVKKALVECRIYVPTLWGLPIHINSGGGYEKFLSENTLFLPLDQRYSSYDIHYICSVVKELIGENN